jgi:dihydrolipoamide dehydrogenase
MDYDVIIIGAGPAGYVAGIRAGQVGLKTAIIEKRRIGGICLNGGCISSKAIIESAKLYRRIKDQAYDFGVEGLDQAKIHFNWQQASKRAQQISSQLTAGVSLMLQKNGVDIIEGEARITSDHSISVENRLLTAQHIIIATGSHHLPLKAKLPPEKVMEIWRLYQLEEIPQNIVVVGESSIAIELAQFFNLIDRNVTLLVPYNRMMPMADEYLANWMLNKLQNDKIQVIFNSYDIADTSHFEGNYLIVGDHKVACDIVINSKLRQGVIPPCEIPLDVKEGFIVTNEFLQTNYPNILAIGDVNGRLMFAHSASAQGYQAINFIKGIKEEVDISKVPLNMYSLPEVAQIGPTEAQLKAQGLQYRVTEYPLSTNGKALCEGNTEGFIRILSEAKYGQVLGVQIIAANATDMISEATAFMQVEATIFDVAKTVHAHPTISEVFMEAGFKAVDEAKNQ